MKTNSTKFMNDVREALTDTEPGTYCIAAVDIEHFRLFNKMYGREAGDELIRYIQEGLDREASENKGVAGYLGGDNFGIFVPDQDELLEHIRDMIVEGIKKWNNTAGFCPLVGVCSVEESSVQPEIIYDHATLALSCAVHRHTDGICRYTPDMESGLEEEVRLLSEIHNGLEKEEFMFYVQPQCNITTGKIVGGEALVRWKKNNGEMVSPGAFIPVLEKNEMIDQLDRYVWRKVCAWMRSWIDGGHSPVPVSINVSRIDIFSMDVPGYILGLLEEYHIPKNLIKIEITESAYTENNERIAYTVTALRSNGLMVMMDDFGSGYSSLNMLKNIPVDVLKLDMRFMDFGEDEDKGVNILEAIVNMARVLHLPIVVEGVETRKQEHFVRDLGCRYTQGFYYYKPLPVDEFEELLSDEKRLDHHGLIYKQVEPLHVREFIDSGFFGDTMLNSILGPAAFYDMYEGQINTMRVNEQYFYLLGINPGEEEEYDTHSWEHVSEDEREYMKDLFEKAYSSDHAGETDGFLHFRKRNGENILVYVRLFFLREKDGHRQFYSSIMDATAFMKKLQETAH